jgi:hypothetical protein
MSDAVLKANPIGADEQNEVYSSLFDRVAALKITTKKGEVQVGKTDATLEEVVRLQNDIMKESARGVTGLKSLVNKITPAVLAKAKQERGKDDLGEVNSFLGMGSFQTEAYDRGYEVIQDYLEKQGQEGNLALKANLLKEFVAKADAIPEGVAKDEKLFTETQEGMARSVVAGAAKGGMKNLPVPAIEYLMKNPSTAAQFDELFGVGAADRVLGKR